MGILPRVVMPIATLLLVGTSGASASSISFVDIFKNVSNVQTGNGNVLSGNGAFFSADVNSTIPNAYTAASFTPPGGAAIGLSLVGTTDYHYQTPSFADQATMDGAFPVGSYDFSATNGATDTTSLSYTADHYAGAAPFLTGTDYASLQGVDSSQAIAFHFNSFTNALSGGNDSAYVFFTIFDVTTNQFVFDAGFQPATTTSDTVAGGTLTAGHQFIYEIDFSNRLDVPTSGTAFDGEIGYESRTSGTFQTAAPVPAPEPATGALLGIALLAGACRRLKGR